jgi:hypothetical protein
MRLHGRPKRLERDWHTDRCPAYRGQPEAALRVCRQNSFDGTPVVERTWGDAGEPCPGCG